MSISAPISVTQSTAPARQSKLPVEGQAWQTALDNAQDAASPQTPTAASPTTTGKAATTPTSPLLASTLQTVSVRHNETPTSSTPPDDGLAVSSADPSIKPATKKEDKKDPPSSSDNALAIAALQVAPQAGTDIKPDMAEADTTTTIQSTGAVAAGVNVGLPAIGQSHPQAAGNKGINPPDPADQTVSAKLDQITTTSSGSAAALKLHQDLAASARSTATPAQAGQAGQSVTQTVNQPHIIQATNQAQAAQVAPPLTPPPPTPTPVGQTVQPPAIAVATTQTSLGSQPSQATTAQTSQTVDDKAHQIAPVTTHQATTLGTMQITSATSGAVTPGGAVQATAPEVSGTISAKPTIMAAKEAVPSAQPVSTASQPVAVSAITMAAANEAGSQLASLNVKKSAEAPQNTPALGSVDSLSPANAAITVGQTAPTSLSANLNNTSLVPSALSATITALHQSGQNGVTLRLDPPGLGHLSVQVKMDAQGAVNVLFVPSTMDAAHMLQNTLPQLGTALAQSGLTLGQAEVGGQFSQSGGQGGQQGGYTQARQPATPFAESPSASASSISGLSAYA